jgi:sortase (surface protein transpeptidase)
VDVPLELQIPSLKKIAAVVGVGLNSNNVMDTPLSTSANDPIWQEVFWYRGGGIPGDVGTATIAGHVDDYLGRQAVFAHLKNLHKGDLIIIRDTRNDHEVRFKVTGIETYNAKQAVDPVILEKIYGSGPVNGEGPQPSDDGLSHLTLITCTGWFINGSFTQRLVIYAIRSG